jgi:rSAM/selenodomain-associated transferase 2
MFLSIIVPVRRPDAQALSALLEQLRPHPMVELVVSVAGDVDNAFMVLRASRPDVKWVTASAGRGPQLNAGAAVATGTWLWFVHADSRLPPEWLQEFGAIDADPDCVGGSFAFGLDSRAWQARLWEIGVTWRVRLFNLPYGDQGIFVRRQVFDRLKGFAPIPLMEDVEFVGRLKHTGRLRHLKAQLTTSARRWERDGWVRRSARNLSLLTLYYCGVPPAHLARLYE